MDGLGYNGTKIDMYTKKNRKKKKSYISAANKKKNVQNKLTLECPYYIHRYDQNISKPMLVNCRNAYLNYYVQFLVGCQSKIGFNRKWCKYNQI